MGGHLSVTIRVDEVSIYKMVWSTSQLWQFQDLSLLNLTEDFVDAELRDYMPGVLAPSGYGLVVADFVTKTLIGCQGFGWLTRKQFVHVFGIDDDDEWESARALIDSGRIKKFTFLDGSEQYVVGYGTDTVSRLARIKQYYDGIRQPNDPMYDALKAKNAKFGYFIIDPKPFTNITDERRMSPDTWVGFKNRLIEMGFVLTPEDLVAWDKWIAAERDILGEPNQMGNLNDAGS